MELFLSTMYQLISMMIMIAFGVILSKLKFINEEMSRLLSKMLLYVIIPLTIILNATTVESNITITNIGLGFMASGIIVIIFIIIGEISFSKEKNAVDKFGTIFANSGFMGIPLATGILGPEGIVYISINIAVMNFVAYSYGFRLLSSNNKNRFKLTDIIFNPGIIGCVIALLFILFKVKLPRVLVTPLSAVSAINTPLAMFIIGNYLCNINISKLLSARVLKISFYRLVLFPLITVFIMWIIPGSIVMKMAIIIALACPTAFHIVAISRECNEDYLFGTQIVVATTIISAITIPVAVLAANYIL